MTVIFRIKNLDVINPSLVHYAVFILVYFIAVSKDEMLAESKMVVTITDSFEKLIDKVRVDN